ncbi:hypothetical protein Ndes2526B_g02233 [Nannochloris sp. 'desiccata']
MNSPKISLMHSQRRASHERSLANFMNSSIASRVKTFLAFLGLCFVLLQLWNLVIPGSLRWSSSPSGGYYTTTDINGLQHHSTSSSSSSTSRQRRFSSSSSSRKQLDKARYFPAKRLQNLIIVACHSVYTGLDFKHPESQSSWLLLDYQKVPGQTQSFLEHIKLGIKQAAADPEAMLMFSGGKTRKEAGPRAEGLGYWLVAEANGWFGHQAAVRERAFTEDHARDSFENLLFGLCRFYELTGHYPASVVVVSYDFKRERFSELHRAALRWPMHRFDFVGTPAVAEGAEIGESSTFNEFEKDPYGCGSMLAKKRALRDPFADGGYAGERCPDLEELLKYCGEGGTGDGFSKGMVFKGNLPWDD